MAVSILAAVVGLTGFLGLTTIQKADDDGFNLGTSSVFVAERVAVGFGNVRVAIRDAILSTTAVDGKAAETLYGDGVKSVEQALKEYAETFINDEDRANFDKLQKAWAAYKPVAQNVLELGVANKNAEGSALLLTPQTKKVIADVTASVATVVAFNQKYVEGVFKTNGQTTDSTILILVIVAGIAVVVALFLGIILANSVIRVVGHVAEGSDTVRTGVDQVASSAQGLAQGSSEQAASLEQVSASVEELSSTVSQNAESASQTERIATKSANDAKEGGVAVSQTVEAMKNISERVVVVQEIARQTNLLSLNAAIEAARAGEHGRGFAVVANEVQKLAERSQTAARDIEDLSRSSVAVAEKAGHLLEQLVPDIQRTADLVAEIHAASNEQASGVTQINAALQQLNSVVQENAAGAEELATTAEEMSAQVTAIRDTVVMLKTGRRETAPANAIEDVSHARRPLPITAHAQSGVRLNLPVHDELDADFKRQ
jgi:methyl-accepting chemotaxis protein